MTEVTIPTGQPRDGWIWISVNGVQQWIKAGEPTELDASEIGVLTDAGISYTAMAGGDFTNIATNDATDGVYTLNGVPCAIGDIIDVAHSDGNFDPLIDVDSGGIKPKDAGGGSVTDTFLYLTEPLLTQILGGYTAVFEVMFEGDAQGAALEATAYDVPDYNITSGLIAQFKIGAPDRIRLVDTANNFTDFSDEFLTSGIHKIAFTATTEKMVASVDGRPIVLVEEPGLDPLCTGYFFAIKDELSARLRSFAFYGVVDDADLPTLSAL
jgi:hypothetical protein